MDKSHKKSQRYKARIASGFATLLLLVTVIICLSVVLQSISNGYVEFAGRSLFRVVTGSMEPTIPIDALLVVHKTEIETVRVDDIVCFRSTNPGSGGMIVTHRVVAVYDTPDGVRCLRTKGDNNLSVDITPVTQQYLIGRVIWHTGDGSKMAGIISFLSGQYGFLACIVLPVLLVAVWVFRDASKNLKKEIKAVQERLEQQDMQNRAKTASAMTDEEYLEMYQRIENEVRKEMEQHAQASQAGNAGTEDNSAQLVDKDCDPLAAALSDETTSVQGEGKRI